MEIRKKQQIIIYRLNIGGREGYAGNRIARKLVNILQTIINLFWHPVLRMIVVLKVVRAKWPSLSGKIRGAGHFNP